MPADRAEELLKRARAAEVEAHRSMAETERLIRQASDLGSLEALNELVRFSVANGKPSEANWLLRNALHQQPDLPPAQLVSIAPDVAGPAWAHDGEGHYDWSGAGRFTVIAADPRRAAATLDRIANKLMLVDELGTVYADEQEFETVFDRYAAEGREIPYTPNFAGHVRWCQFGADIALDTKGIMSEAMARAMAEVIAEALCSDGVAGHVTNWRPELDHMMAVWNGEAHNS